MPDRQVSESPELVVQTEHLDAAAAAWLKQRCEVVSCSWENQAALAAVLPRATALLIRTYTIVNDALLDRAPNLRVVARAGVGLDNVDIPACQRRGIQVVSTPGANTRAVVELVTAFMLDALRPRVFLDKPLDRAAWNAARKDLTAEKQLSTLTLGIVGLGRVGSAVARIGAALDMRVLYNDLRTFHVEQRFGANPASLESIFRDSDIVSIHVDGRPENRSLIGPAAFALARPDLLFLNTSRGFVVDTSALAAFLTNNPAAQAMIDVHEPEPIAPDSPLLPLKNAHLSPHIGAATAQAQANMSWVVKDLWRVLSGEPPENPAWQ